MFEGKNNEIRRLMRKFSLRVNRLQRVKFGPYTLGKIPEPNDLVEVPVVSSIRRIMFQYYRDRTKSANTVVKEEEEQMIIGKTKKAFKESRNNKRMGLSDFVSSESSMGLEMLGH
jgi:hypothetical protein